MKEFINRLKKSMNSDFYFEQETPAFKILTAFAVFFEMLFYLFAFIAVPFWAVPYFVYSVLKDKKAYKKRK